MKEIEKKYLVHLTTWKSLKKGQPITIRQGYISKEINATVRVRTKNDKGFLTIKGKTVGITRDEFEYEIPFAEATELLSNFCERYIDKDRYEIQHENHLWEVDVFHGKLEGLVLAEIELKSDDEPFSKPNWITEDVSENPDYYNAVLINRC